jgi:uncharacterized protein
MVKKFFYTFQQTEKKEYSPLTTVLIKPVGPRCNLECSYCFYLEKLKFVDSKVKKMSFDVLKSVVNQLCSQSSQNVHFLFQGGEPMLAGLDFFKNAVKYQARYKDNRAIENSLQTNGMLINKKWAEFLRDNNFLVGLSLDGPEDIQDHYRISNSGRGSWRQVMNSLELMLKTDVQVNTLSVVTDKSVKEPERLYNFFKDHGITYMQFIPCVEVDKGEANKMAPYAVDPDEYGEFLCKMFDLWLSDFEDGKPTTFVRFFNDLFYLYVDKQPPDCTLMPECGSYVVVEADGSIFSCDFFVEDEWKLGNVQDTTLPDAWLSKKQLEFGNNKANRHEDCEACKYLQYCFGGCPKDRLHNVTDTRKSYLCKSYIKFHTYSQERFKSLAKDYKSDPENS